jgi:hypothetical protein
MKSFLPSLPVLLPIVFEWAEQQETLILANGSPLTECQQADAGRAGVAHPDKIRLLQVETLPQPDHDELKFIAKQIGLFSARSAGINFGYGIYVRRGFWEDRETLVHECVHIAQHEKRNGLRPFLTEYLRECLDPGSPSVAWNRKPSLGPGTSAGKPIPPSRQMKQMHSLSLPLSSCVRF